MTASRFGSEETLRAGRGQATVELGDGAHPGEAADTLARRGLHARVEARLFGSAAPVRLGRFVVLDALGQGGFGSVHAAYDPQLDRRVALKVIRADRGLAQARADALREAQALARLSHPNIVAIHDAFESEEGLIVLALELVEGQSLAQWLRAHPVEDRDPKALLEIMRAAATGLAAAHDAGLTHRDFKPGNVLIADGGRVCVADFGLARMQEELAADPSVDHDGPRRTAAGGTPPFMAPEQYDAPGTNPAVDVYAYAVTLYLGLTGRYPFDGDDVEDVRRAKRAGGAPALPRGCAAGRVRRLVAEALAPDPAQRPASMQAFVHALRPVAWRPAALVTFVAAAAATAGSLVSPTRGPCDELPVVIDAPSASLRDAARSRGLGEAAAASIADELNLFAEQWGQRRARACGPRGGSTPHAARVGLATCLRGSHAQHARALEGLHARPSTRGAPELDADVSAVFQLRTDLERCDRSRAVELVGGLGPGRSRHAALPALLARGSAEDLDAALADLADEDDPVARVQLQTALARRASGTNDPGAARRHALDAITTAEQAGLDLAGAEAAMVLAQSLAFSGESRQAQRWIAVADAKLDRVAPGPAARAALEWSRGHTEVLLGRADVALRSLDAAHTRFLALGFDVAAASVESEIVIALENLGRFEDAVGRGRHALAVLQQHLGGAHYQSRYVARATAQAALELGDLALGRELLVQALHGDVGDELDAIARATLGRALLLAGELPEAKRALQEVAARWEDHAHGDPRFGTLAVDLTRVHAALGETAAARDWAERAAASLRGHKGEAIGLVLLGHTALEHDVGVDPIPWLRRALSLHQDAEASPAVRGEAALALARALARTPSGGAEARALAHQAIRGLQQSERPDARAMLDRARALLEETPQSATAPPSR